MPTFDSVVFEHARDLGVGETAGELERHEVAVAGVEGGERGADHVALERELGLLVRTRQGAVLGLVAQLGVALRLRSSSSAALRAIPNSHASVVPRPAR